MAADKDPQMQMFCETRPVRKKKSSAIFQVVWNSSLCKYLFWL